MSAPQGQLQLTDIVKGRIAYIAKVFRVKGNRLIAPDPREALITSDLSENLFRYLPSGERAEITIHAGLTGMIPSYCPPSTLNLYGAEPHPPRIGASTIRFFDTIENAKKWLEDEKAEVVPVDEVHAAVQATVDLCAQLTMEKVRRNSLHGGIGKPIISDKDLHASIGRSIEISDKLRNDPSF